MRWMRDAVYYNNRNFVNMNFKERKQIRREIGMLFQGSALFDSLNRGRECYVSAEHVHQHDP